VDSTAVGRLAAEYMLQQGYAHFACHVESRIAFSRLSLTGFADRLTEAGHACAKFDTGADNVAGIAPAGVRSATAAWLHELPKPVGVFTHSDVRAASILKICLEAGIDVPNEAGIIGNDNDLIIGPATKPTLTSIDNAPELVGYRAASVLVDLIRGEPPRHNRELVPPRSVIERQSTQPAFVADESLRQAMRFIRAHAADAITVDDVVRHVPLSRRTLERRFQSHLARSPADEIRRVHFERARHLLAETSLKLSEVAIASGYSRFSSFATAFQAAHERTPSEYRVAFRTR
jgi:LacI family transcriptional regulator